MANPRLIGTAVLCCLLIAPLGLTQTETGRAAALADLEINEVVEGDVVAFGGNVVLGRDARVSGHAVAIFGSVQKHPEAVVQGRAIAISSLDSLKLAATDGASSPGLEAALRVCAAGVWLLATTLIAYLYPARVRFGVWLVPSIGMKILVLGVLVYVTLFAALVAIIALGPKLGVPLFAAVAVLFLLVRAIGLAVIGATVGGALLRRLTARPLPVTVEVFVGVALILAARFLPLVGGVVWTGMGLVALGAAVFTVALAPQHGAVEAARSSTVPRQ
jgi:hypothetical protein